MKVKSLSLSWFRGVGSQLTLAPDGRSVVVYGPNGSGKSTFPDALEYLVSGGKIGHLAHEYSGSRLERAVRNTHAPAEEPAAIELEMADGERVRVEISASGKAAFDSSSSTELVGTLNAVGLERLILRQDEVSHFIHATKGQKYSALLPLLGLEDLELAAHNLNVLRLAVLKLGELEEKRGRLEELEAQARQVWPELSKEGVTEALGELASRHGQKREGAAGSIESLEVAIDSRIAALEDECRRFDVLTRIADSGLDGILEDLGSAEAVLRAEADRLLEHRVGVLEATERFSKEVKEEETDCPACGRSIPSKALSDHVRETLIQLQRAQAARLRVHRGRRAFSSALSSVLENVAPWRHVDVPEEASELANALTALGRVEPAAIEGGLGTEVLESLRAPISLLLSRARKETVSRPPSAAELVEDGKAVRAARGYLEAQRLREEIARLERLESALLECEKRVREETRRKTKAVVDGLSKDIERLWEKLHPGERVEDIHLHIPGDADKAIDIALKFHGVDQPSPRLALSEGHRNSLGLCIFFALALATEQKTPIVLDDIVSSLDREHRGMLVDVFLEDFSARQVLLFTHDREWFSELRSRLPDKYWQFRRLKAWSDPAAGSQWLGASGTFDDARALLEVKAEAAGNEVRKIMDVELAKIAERLHVPMAFLRGDSNEHRTAHDFLEKIVSLGERKFTRKNAAEWKPFTEAAEAWEECDKLLVSWGNRASHGGTLTRAEAERLIAIAEQALGVFKCPECMDAVWASEQPGRERVQCSCGTLRWKHG